MSENKRQCWAACLGDCKGPLSMEHIASQSIMSGDFLTSRGMRRSPSGETRPVGKIGTRMLCKHHNESTSDLDNCAGNLSKALQGFWGRRESASIVLNGHEFERWSLKLFINMLACGWFLPEKVMTPSPFVEIVFGRRPFTGLAGLYGYVTINHRCDPDNFDFMPLVEEKNGEYKASGIIFNFHSVAFAMMLLDGDHRNYLSTFKAPPQVPFQGGEAVHHPKMMGLKRTNAVLEVTFDWGASGNMIASFT